MHGHSLHLVGNKILKKFVSNPSNCISEVQLSPYTSVFADTWTPCPEPCIPEQSKGVKLGSAHKARVVRLLLDRKSFGEDKAVEPRSST